MSHVKSCYKCGEYFTSREKLNSHLYHIHRMKFHVSNSDGHYPKKDSQDYLHRSKRTEDSRSREEDYFADNNYKKYMKNKDRGYFKDSQLTENTSFYGHQYHSHSAKQFSASHPNCRHSSKSFEYSKHFPNQQPVKEFRDRYRSVSNNNVLYCSESSKMCFSMRKSDASYAPYLDENENFSYSTKNLKKSSFYSFDHANSPRFDMKRHESCHSFNERFVYFDSHCSYDLPNIAKKGKEKLQEIRAERFTKYGEEITKHRKSQKYQQDGFVFRVLSWNILSQKLMEQHRYLYSQSHNASLEWEYRKNLILSEIKDSNADILTLQEVEEVSFHSLKELKDLGYEGIFKKRTNDKIDGCAIYYRPDALMLKEYSFVEFYQPGVRLLDRDNIGIVARFEPKSFRGTEFIIATTHLLYNPRRHDIKLVQMQLLLAEIERLSFSGAIRQDDKMIPMYHPCILTGDLNLTPQTGVYNLITEGELEYDQLSSRNLTNSDSPHSYHTLPRLLLPPYLGITNNCQHDKVVSHRKLMRQSTEEERHLMQLYNSDKKLDNSLKTEERIDFTEEDLRNPNNTDVRKKYGTGVLSHNLKFKSVYTHEKDGKPEATTHQDWWMTVDYIFYSPVSRKNKEANLRLISYKGLPTAEEAEDYIKALPNLFCGSDHLPLVSSFFLNKS